MSISINFVRQYFLGICIGYACLLITPTVHALSITDAAIFSSNPEGEAYSGLIWNTVGNPPDLINRWNLYFSSSTDINNPIFLNDENDSRASIDIPLTPGIHSFGMYGDAAGSHSDHFTLSLYFNGITGMPGISAAAPANGGPTDLVVATHPDGLGLIDTPFSVANAGSLSFLADGMLVTLTKYFWETDITNHPNLVWPHNQRHNFDPSPSGADFYGQITLAVTNVPEPASLALFGIGLAGIGIARRRKPNTKTEGFD